MISSGSFKKDQRHLISVQKRNNVLRKLIDVITPQVLTPLSLCIHIVRFLWHITVEQIGFRIPFRLFKSIELTRFPKSIILKEGQIFYFSNVNYPCAK